MDIEKMQKERAEKFPKFKNYGICPVCNGKIETEEGHKSCQINCVQCNQILKNLDFYYFTGESFYRFCSEECSNIS